MFKAATQTSLHDIRYKGCAPALTAVLSGEVDATFDGITNCLPFARSGKLEIPGVSSERRAPAAETIPTMVESGYPEPVAYSWFGVAAPAGTPAAIVDRRKPRDQCKPAGARAARRRVLRADPVT
jgi:tripartite-type tricarboxylate transporter receptor subunit TctC